LALVLAFTLTGFSASPQTAAGSSAARAKAKTAAAAEKLDINSATKSQLDTLPGIGDKRSEDH